MAITYVRTENDGTGGSRSVDREIAVKSVGISPETRIPEGVDPTSVTWISEWIPVEGLQFSDVRVDNYVEWHNPHWPCIIIVLSGEMEVETTDGDVRRFGPGEVVHNVAVDGKGVKGRTVSAPVRLLFARLSGTPVSGEVGLG